MDSSRVDLRLDWATHAAAKFAVDNWHYSRRMPKSKLAKIGVWENGKFIGIVIFGVGATSSLVKRYGLRPEQGCELVRVALTRHQTAVTRIVAIALKMMHRAFPGLRLVVSFADPEQGHHGGIYQGGGWIYAGQSEAADEYIFLGRRWQGRSFRNRFSGMERDHRVTIIKGSAKYRYLMPLDDEMRRDVESLRQPYPRAGSRDVAAPPDQGGEDGSIPIPALPLESGNVKT